MGGMLIGYPIVSAISVLMNLDNQAVSIAYRGTYLLFVCIYILLGIKSNKYWYKGYIWYLMILFWMIYLWRIIEYGTFDEQGDKILFFAIGASLIPSIAFMRSFREESLNQVEKWTFISLYLTVIFYGYVLLFSGRFDIFEIGRASVEYLNPISLGNLGACLALLGIYRAFLNQKDNRTWNYKIVSYSAICLGLLTVFSSASRSPLLGFMITAILGMVLRNQQYKGMRFLIKMIGLILFWSIIIFVGAYIIIYLQDIYNFHMMSRILIFFDNAQQDQSTAEHLIAWKGAFNQFLDNPLFGDYLVERSLGFYPHNVLLESYMSTGLVGGLSFTVWFLSTAISITKLLKSRHSYSWIALLATQFLIGGLFSGAIWSNSQMLCLGSVVIAFAYTNSLKKY